MAGRLRDERGQVLVLVAVAMVALVGAAGLAIDVGYEPGVTGRAATSADAGGG